MLRMSFLFAFVLLLAQNVYSQRASNKLNLSGTVLGYTYDDSKGLFNRNETLEVEGSEPNVWMEILDIDGVLVNKTTSSSSGEFSVYLELGSKYAALKASLSKFSTEEKLEIILSFCDFLTGFMVVIKFSFPGVLIAKKFSNASSFLSECLTIF